MDVLVPLTLQTTYAKGMTVAEKDLRTAFDKYGPVTSVVSQGATGIVDFCSHVDAITAMRELNDPSGTTMKVTLAPGEGERLRLPQDLYSEPKLFVAPISPEWDEDTCRAHFAQFGDVLEIVSLAKGGAFVRYDNMKSATVAIEHHLKNPVQHPGTNRVMKVTLAQSKEQQSNPYLPSTSYVPAPPKFHFESSRPINIPVNNVVFNGGYTLPQTVAPTGKGPIGANLFVHNHPPSFTNMDLENLFSPYGQIISLSTQWDKTTNKSKGYSFVSYSNSRSAEAAISELNGAVIHGKRIEVSIKKGEQAAPFSRSNVQTNQNMMVHSMVLQQMISNPPRKQMQIPGGKLFVHLSNPVSDLELLRLFQPYGTVVECALQKDPTGRPKNFGFVNYDSVVSAVQAVKALHGLVLPDQSAPLDVSIKKGEEHHAEPFQNMTMGKGPDGCNLFVRRIPDTWTEDDLMAHFGQFGEIYSVKINIDPKTGLKKGYGFVSYGESAHAQLAIQRMHGQTVEGRFTLDVSIKVAKA